MFDISFGDLIPGESSASALWEATRMAPRLRNLRLPRRRSHCSSSRVRLSVGRRTTENVAGKSLTARVLHRGRSALSIRRKTR
jgi:hypothetical protein